jgi:monofunctional biosynthetic peptidoglycan transglycosylase
MRHVIRFLFVGLPRLLVLGLLALALVWLFLPWPLTLRWRDPDTTSVMRHQLREARERGDSLPLRYDPVPLARMSSSLASAVLTAEDGRFREHGGVDWVALGEEVSYDGDGPFSPLDPDDWAALRRALEYGFAHRDELRGRSTITQQLAKNLYFTPERSLPRKVAELFVAQRLEWILSKDRILELYLNTVELGPGIFGVEAAAREYFDVPASELSRWQAATLAATLPHPLTSNPRTSPGRMAWRRDLILQYMGAGRRTTIPDAPPEIVVPDLRLEPVDTGGGAVDTTVIDTTRAAADTGGAVIDTSGAVIDTAGAVVDTGGAEVDTEGAVIDTSGAVIDTGGAVVDTGGATGAAGDTTGAVTDTTGAVVDTIPSDGGAHR